jgi:hypothetical protein
MSDHQHERSQPSVGERRRRGPELSPQEFFFEPIAVGRHGHSAVP